jgi:Xaa-Pro aminopeptidase
MDDYDAILCIASSEHDSNMYYATGFLVPDAFIFFEKDGKKFIVLSDLEIERGKQQANVDEILSLSKYRKQLEDRGIDNPELIDITNDVLQDYQIKSVLVPGNFAIQYADPLRERGYTVHYKDPFFETRAIKTSQEIEYIQQAQKKNEHVMDYAIQIIKESEIGADNCLYYRGSVLTSEFMQRQIQMKLLELDYLAHGTIVSCGDQATRPHEHGSGPLLAHHAIIIDIFPQSLISRYFADMTRTVVKGTASDALKRLYDAVLAAQEIAFETIRDGVNGHDVHQQIQEMFTHEGFETGVIDGTVQGFFHGTGHGLGLDIHEAPRIGNVDMTLHAGNVVTVEPGLYYIGIGGVRIEDIAVVTKDGCINLTTYPKELEL